MFLMPDVLDVTYSSTKEVSIQLSRKRGRFYRVQLIDSSSSSSPSPFHDFFLGPHVLMNFRFVYVFNLCWCCQRQ